MSAQISPPGLGRAHAADWFALGLRQDLDTVKAWQSMSYVGLGRKSRPNTYNPLARPAILILNQEFYHQFHSCWQYSVAVSYRRQNEYLPEAPYARADPSFKQELRTYGRLSYIYKSARLKLVPTFRQEIRTFYGPDFTTWKEQFQFRTRFRLQITLNLDPRKTHRFIASGEPLFSISKSNAGLWSDFNYRESRVSAYYSFSPPRSRWIFNIGYMNNLVGKHQPYDVHYLALDVVLENPFRLRMRAKDNIPENFE